MTDIKKRHIGFSDFQNYIKPKPVRVIAITSGKGGVGKTNISVNLAIMLTIMGDSVLLMDADLGMGNVDIFLGLEPAENLSNLVFGNQNIENIMLSDKSGINIIPGSNGVYRMANLSKREQVGIIHAFSDMSFGPDNLVIDTASGISDTALTFAKASHEVVVVVCNEPASISDACSFITVLSQDRNIKKFRILANRVSSSQEGINLYRILTKKIERNVDTTLDYLGSIPEDDCIKKAIQKQKSLIELYPRSKSAIAFKKIAEKITKWPTPQAASGDIEFFLEKLFISSTSSV